MDQADRDVVPPVKAAGLVVNIRQPLMPWGQATRQGCDRSLNPVGRRLKQRMGPLASAPSESRAARVVQSGAQERLVAEWDKRH